MKKRNKILLVFIFIVISLLISNKSFAETVKTMTIVLDPGHGGHESGAVNSQYGILEKDINLTTARYLRDYLNNYYGINIIMTHDGLPLDQEMEVVDRSMVARNNNADLLLCLHYNAAGENEQSADGAEVYVTYNKSQYKYNEESTEIGNLILRNLGSLGIRSRGVKTKLCNDTEEKWQYYDGSRADYYGIIRYAMKGDGEDRGIDFSKGAGITTILIEHAFIRGRDYQFFNTNEKIRKIAEADGSAIVEHYNLKLKTEVPNSIALDKENLILSIGEKEKITATIIPETAINKKVIWSTSNENIAKINNDGEIEAISEGKATITVTADGNDAVKKEIQVEVIKPYIEIENGEEANAVLGSRLQLFKDIGKLDSKVTWQSENNQIATVDENGLITTTGEGSTTIKAKLEEYAVEDTIKINVTKLEDNQKIEILDYKEENGIISKFERMTTKDDFIKHIKIPENYKIEVEYKDEKNEYIGTGTKIKILDENNIVVQNYIARLYADVNGDGRISAMDFTYIRNHIMEVQAITEENTKLASDVNGDGRISTMDFTLIRNDIMDVQKIVTK